MCSTANEFNVDKNLMKLHGGFLTNLAPGSIFKNKSTHHEIAYRLIISDEISIWVTFVDNDPDIEIICSHRIYAAHWREIIFS